MEKISLIDASDTLGLMFGLSEQREIQLDKQLTTHHINLAYEKLTASRNQEGIWIDAYEFLKPALEMAKNINEQLYVAYRSAQMLEQLDKDLTKRSFALLN